MLEETARVRMARACRPLKSTSLKIYEVAAQCGFRSSSPLKNVQEAADLQSRPTETAVSRRSGAPL